MQKIAEDEGAYLHVLRVVMIAFLKGTAPIMAVEFARRAIPGHVRPGFLEVEKHCKKSGEPTPAATEGGSAAAEAPAAAEPPAADAASA
jgi:chemotaxis protein MotA